MLGADSSDVIIASFGTEQCEPPLPVAVSLRSGTTIRQTPSRTGSLTKWAPCGLWHRESGQLIPQRTCSSGTLNMLRYLHDRIPWLRKTGNGSCQVSAALYYTSISTEADSF